MLFWYKQTNGMKKIQPIEDILSSSYFKVNIFNICSETLEKQQLSVARHSDRQTTIISDGRPSQVIIILSDPEIRCRTQTSKLKGFLRKKFFYLQKNVVILLYTLDKLRYGMKPDTC